jgi:hypothetical protein
MPHQHDIHLIIFVNKEWMNYIQSFAFLNSIINRDLYEPILPLRRSMQEGKFCRCRPFILRLFCYLIRRCCSRHVENDKMIPSLLILFSLLSSLIAPESTYCYCTYLHVEGK